MANQFCNTCGSSMDANATFCTNCGTTKSASTQQYANPAPNYVPPVQQPYYQQPVQTNFQNNAMNSQPLGVGQYIGMMIVSGIPLVGFIMLLVWSFGSNANINKKNYARAVLIVAIVGGILAAIFSGVLIAALVPFLEELMSTMGGSYY